MSRFECKVDGCGFRGSSGLCKFPEDPVKAQKWADAIGNATYKKNHYICHKHFDAENDFITMANGSKRPKPDAIPSKNTPSLVSMFFTLHSGVNLQIYFKSRFVHNF